MEIRWWDWPLDRISSCLDLLVSPDIDAFIAEAETVAQGRSQRAPRPG